MIALNTQPIEKQEQVVDGSLDIVSCFETLQGEGPFVGCPSVFVRTAGCSILCPKCDTDYISNRKRYSVTELMDTVKSKRQSGLVVITGGEPLRQNIGPFAYSCFFHGYKVQIETNGTLYQDAVDYKLMTVVCSPKTPKLNEQLLPWISCYKYVGAAGELSEEDGLPLTTLGNSCGVARPHQGFRGEIFLQPLDVQDGEQNKRNQDACIESCMKHGYRLTLQTHKYLGLE